MGANEKYALKWNEFQSNLMSSYRDLRKNPAFHDVTLICNADMKNPTGQSVVLKAHKVVLSTSSVFFNDVFSRDNTFTTHPHPAMYMNDISPKTLQYVLDFIYCGEVSVKQEDLDTFIAVAERLRIKGLTQDESADEVPMAMVPGSNPSDVSSSNNFLHIKDEPVEDDDSSAGTSFSVPSKRPLPSSNQTQSSVISNFKKSRAASSSSTQSSPAIKPSTSSVDNNSNINVSAAENAMLQEGSAAGHEEIKAEVYPGTAELGDESYYDENYEGEDFDDYGGGAGGEDGGAGGDANGANVSSEGVRMLVDNVEDRNRVLAENSITTSNGSFCRICKANFKTFPSLRTHFYNFHFVSETGCVYRCPQCGSMFNSTYSIRKHLKSCNPTLCGADIQTFSI